MFQGESNISIDDKGRMAIPTAWRDTLAAVCGNRLMLTYNPFDPGCLWLFPHEEWRRARDQVAALHSFNTAHRQLRRALIGSAAELGEARARVEQHGVEVTPVPARSLSETSPEEHS